MRRSAPDSPRTPGSSRVPRPAPNENFLLVSASAHLPASPLVPVARRIADAGCNLVDARLATIGGESTLIALASGSWDAIAKLESALARLEREDTLRVQHFRTSAKPQQPTLLPYLVEIVAADKPGIVSEVAEFFAQQGITIDSLSCTRYRAIQTGAEMFQAQLTVGIPADLHIAALRDDFLDFCDQLNLDAIIDPIKY
ncbi:MAG: glycine cleavage system protein R [Xanthomonadales bacterium]|nr:glycine cleavage system protein R [Xanthomonadales bacterium]